MSTPYRFQYVQLCHTRSLQEVEVKLCSVVMKAVQAHTAPGGIAEATSSPEAGRKTAGKLGDDANAAKAQVCLHFSLALF